MCGITAIQLKNKEESVSHELVESLTYLQHRGQDASGVITCAKGGKFYQRKGNGLVTQVFNPSNTNDLIGNYGVGHGIQFFYDLVRYPTAGTSSNSEAQPFYVNSPYGIVLAHNGNLTNSRELKEFLDYEAHRHINTDSDSEILLSILAHNLHMTRKFRIEEDDIFESIKEAMQVCKGGFSCVGMIAGFRDPHGIRPLIYGRRKALDGYDYGIASESVALKSLGFSDLIDIKPGQAIIITDKKLSIKMLVSDKPFTPCLFEYVYFSRPDSILDKISVYKSRLAMGEFLAQTVKDYIEERGINIDVVIPVPETSRPSALQLAQTLSLKYREGFCKNRYIGRTFIMPGKKERSKTVRKKLSIMSLEFKNKDVLLVDDSIVRGTTSREIIQMAREAGAKSVYLASCAPPLKYPNVYGIDIPCSEDLVAHKRNSDEVAKFINADGVIFQKIDDLIKSCQKFNPQIEDFETSVFDGNYITGDISKAYLDHLRILRSEHAKNKSVMSSEAIGLYNSYS